MAELLVRLHLAGFFWGDCSLSNTLFRRDAGGLSAYLVDAETGELHPASPTASASTTSRSPRRTSSASCSTSQPSTAPAVGDRPDRDRAEGLRRYGALWAELTRSDIVGDDERFRIEERLRRLNDLGFDVEQIELEATPEGYRLRLEPQLVEPGHHRRRLLMLTGLSAQENQARRMLHDLDEFRARLGAPESVAAYRWRAEVFEPAIAAVPPELWGKRQAAEVFHEILEHRWLLSERRGADVGLDTAVQAYVTDVLSHAPDERSVLESDDLL